MRACAKIALGLRLILLAGRRAFYRRNEYDTEEFRSFAHMMGSNLVEGVSVLVGIALLFGGITLAVFASIGRS
jgi:hypothetical protein